MGYLNRGVLRWLAAATLLFSTAFAQTAASRGQNSKANSTQNLREMVQLPAGEKPEADTPISDKARRLVVNQLLERVLLETAHARAPQAPREKIDTWVKKSVGSRFQAYCPSFSARRLGNEIEVTVVLAIQPFLDDLARAGFAAGPSGALRAAVLVLDESSGELTQMSLAQIEKTAASPRLPSDFEVTGVNSAADRAGIYGQTLHSKLRAQGVVFDANWSTIAARLVREALPQGVRWPEQSLPVTLWQWNGETGLVFLVGVSRGDKLGIVTRSDVILVQAGRVKRSYWSRTLNDPTAQDGAVAILNRTANQAQRLLSSPLLEESEAQLRLAVDKNVSEKELGEIEKALRELAVGQDTLLIPLEVNKNEIRYRLQLPLSRADRVLEKIKLNVPKVSARLAPGDGGMIFVRMN